MHAITGIIIYDVGQYGVPSIKDDSDAKYTAESILNEHEGIVYDWYTVGRGRFSNTYGKDVYRATDKEFFIVVDSLIDAQYRNFECARNSLGDSFDYYNALYEHGSGNPPDYSGWYLSKYANFINGAFTFDSHIYDSYFETSRVTKKMIEDYKAHPENYYLVLFDVHN